MKWVSPLKRASYPLDSDPGVVTPSTDAETSFSAIIDHLQEKNEELTKELSHVKKAAAEAHQAHQRLEDRQKASETDLNQARAEIERLREDRVRLDAQVKKYSKRLRKIDKELRASFSAIQRCGLNIDGQPPARKVKSFS